MQFNQGKTSVAFWLKFQVNSLVVLKIVFAHSKSKPPLLFLLLFCRFQIVLVIKRRNFDRNFFQGKHFSRKLFTFSQNSQSRNKTAAKFFVGT